jgi:serine protease Do
LFRLLLIPILLFFVSCTSQPVPLRIPLDEHDLYLKMKQATLVLLVNKQETGTAAFISSDGYIASAAHCIRYRDDKIEVISAQFGQIPVKLIAIDKAHDFMLLKADLTKKAHFLPPAKNKLRPPEKVYLMGSSIYRRGIFQIGTVAREDTYFEYYGGVHSHYFETIHIAASVQGGTSGGPWVNRFGEYVGVQSGQLLIENSPSGISFLTPVTHFKNIIETKKSARSYNLDFHVDPLVAQSPSTINRYKGYTQGLVVTNINATSVAKESGLSKWDLIVAINDTPVRTIKELIVEVRRLKANSVRLTIVQLDKKESKILVVPVDIVEDRITFKNPPKEVSVQ